MAQTFPCAERQAGREQFLRRGNCGTRIISAAMVMSLCTWPGGAAWGTSFRPSPAANFPIALQQHLLYATALESRLVAELRKAWQSAEPSKREGITLAYLCDALPVVRSLGLELVENEVGDGAASSNAIALTVRELLFDDDPGVRAAAVRVVVTLRSPDDARTIVELLERTVDPSMRAVLLNGLGYLGEADAADVFFGELENSRDSLCRMAAINGLGRLAERAKLSGAASEMAQAVLVCEWDSFSPDADESLRERILWALGRVGDEQLGAFFIRALADVRQASVRLVALTALGRWDSPEVQAALIAACDDIEPEIRRAALDLVARRPALANAYTALWRRAVERRFADAERQVAWGGVIRHLSGKPWADIRAAMRGLPLNDSATPARCEELAGLALASAAQSPDPDGWRTEVRKVQAEVCRSAGAASAALRAYMAGLVEAGDKSAAVRVELSLELLQFALRSDQYQAAVHDALVRSLSREEAWKQLWTVLDALRREDPTLCLAACRAVQMAAAKDTSDFTGRLDSMIGDLGRMLDGDLQSSDAASQPAVRREAQNGTAS